MPVKQNLRLPGHTLPVLAPGALLALEGHTQRRDLARSGIGIKDGLETHTRVARRPVPRPAAPVRARQRGPADVRTAVVQARYRAEDKPRAAIVAGLVAHVDNTEIRVHVDEDAGSARVLYTIRI